jgi:sortase A
VKANFIRIRWAESALIGIGLAFLAVWGGAWVYRSVSSRAAVKRFEMDQSHAPAVNSTLVGDPASSFGIDFALWSPKRTQAYKDSLAVKTDQPLAVLRIPKIQLEVPVYNDTDDLTLDRGVGRILGTGRVGGGGNLGIAGHRDGFFRGLKDVAQDDEIDLDRTGGSDTYLIEKIQIVNPDDVSVLAPTPTPTLTLVTCFPFYFVGSAPQRYIVTASLTNSSGSINGAAENLNPRGSKTNKKEN